MTSILSLAFVLVVFAVADIISTKTKSIISAMFTCTVLFIVGFWLGVPKTLFADANLSAIGGLLITSLLVHMGTMMSLKQLKAQWKTVVIALGAVVGITILILILGPIFMDRETALVGAPVLAGGVIAAQKMQETFKTVIELATAKLASGEMTQDAFDTLSNKAASLQVFSTVLMVMEGFIGYPIASYMLKKEAVRVKKDIDAGTYEQDSELKLNKKKLLPQLPEALCSENFYLAKVVLTALFATWLASLSSKGLTALGFPFPSILDKNIISLILGIVFTEIGFLETDILTKANSSGLAMASLMAVVFGSLAAATPAMLLELLPRIAITQVLGVIGYAAFGILVGYLIKVSPWMSTAIGSTANYGFPGTFVISNEVAKAVGKTPDERKKVLDAILPKMLVAGFITVSITSVFIASITSAMVLKDWL
jgi:hypothetical protein